MTRKVSFVVELEDENLRLDQFLTIKLASLYPEFNRSQIKNLFTENCIVVDSAIARKAGQKVSAQQQITVHIPEVKKLDLVPVALDLEILYEDEYIAVINKPSGISVHPSHTENNTTLVHGLLAQLKTLSSIGGVERPGIVHRLDKGTSGVLVISKTDEAHRILSSLFKTHDLTRRYFALCWNDLSKKGASGTINTFFGRHPKDRKRMTGKLSEGRKAITHWKVKEVFTIDTCKLSYVECTLETGRTHQIRVHLSEFGFPIIGDELYGTPAYLKLMKKPALKDSLVNINHPLLHATVLEFKHPITNQIMKFKTEPPEDFQGILEQLKKLV